MVKWKGSREKTKYFVCFIVLWFLQMAAAFWFCTQKQGFHEDEYYTYYSTARTNGFYVEDGEWMERDVYRNEFVVLPGQQFQYGLVKQVQSWDVHPPMYYWVFHTVASLASGVFSKWTGLSVNLFFHGMNLILLTYLSYLAAGRDERLPFPVLFVYGFSPAAMSGVVFIRMYEMLTTFVLLCAILHVRAVLGLQDGFRQKKSGWEEKVDPADEGKPQPGEEGGSGGRRWTALPVKTLLAMAAVTYVGFLTQYYYFIFLFFLAIFFCIWMLWRDRNIRNCLRYGISQGMAFILAYLTYPAFPGQMFKGQRGAQATENFFNLSNTFERICFFWDLLNRYVFGGLLGLMLLFLVAAVAVRRVGVAGKRQGTPGLVFYMLLFTAAGYFLTVSKTGLLLGDTSNRYQLPVYGIMVLLLVLGAAFLLRQTDGTWAAEEKGGEKGTSLPIRAALHEKRMIGIAVTFSLALVALSYVRADVVFLYREDMEQTAWAGKRAAADTPVVYFYKPGEEWCIWDVTNELLMYPAVCFVSADSPDPVADARLEDADSLVIYLAKGTDAREQIARLGGKDSASVQNGLQLVFEEKYCDVYDLSR